MKETIKPAKASAGRGERAVRLFLARTQTNKQLGMPPHAPQTTVQCNDDNEEHKPSDNRSGRQQSGG
jgi:hypothetical protein